jgi:RNA polymerase sigma factor (sigma-70 family)
LLDGGAPGDRQLLERFARRRDGEAFAALVRRHGPMVLGVCRRVLGDHHAADDAFQLTFLVLARKAGGLSQPDRLAPWLYGVAHRTAAKARARTDRRRKRERPVRDLPAADSGDPLVWRDLRPVLDDIIGRLPPPYRDPFILCYLDGLTNAEAARRLGCPPGTVATRLARARERLRGQLARRGVTLPAGLAAAELARELAPAAVSAGCAAVAVRAALSPAVNGGAVAAFLEGAYRSMAANRWRILAATVLAVGLAGGAGLGLRSGPAGAQDSLPPRAAPPAPVRAESDDAPHVCRTENFCVDAPNRRIAELIAQAAERHRSEQARRWLGRELPPWPVLCPIKVTITMSGVAGATEFDFHDGQVRGQRMQLEGPLDRMLANSLPHEVTHTVLAHHFGRPVPRWADEGIAILSEDSLEQERHDRLARELVNAGRAIRLRTLLPLTSYPPEVMTLFAEGYSVTRFLVERKDRPTLLAFVKDGLGGDWDKAVKNHYGFENVEALEKEWLASLQPVRAGQADRPAAPPEAGGVNGLARGPAPLIAQAAAGPDGRVLIFYAAACYSPVTRYVRNVDDYRPETSYVLRQQSYFVGPKADEVQAFTAEGRRLTSDQLRERLRGEPAYPTVLISADRKPVNPLHLRVVKPDTVILILPDMGHDASLLPVIPVPPMPANPPSEAPPPPSGR